MQVDLAGLDVQMVSLAQKQGKLQVSLDRKQALSEQLTKVISAPSLFVKLNRH